MAETRDLSLSEKQEIADRILGEDIRPRLIKMIDGNPVPFGVFPLDRLGYHDDFGYYLQDSGCRVPVKAIAGFYKIRTPRRIILLLDLDIICIAEVQYGAS